MKCYFLCFRMDKNAGQIDWDNPTGGLVMEAENIVFDMAVATQEQCNLAREILSQRYHPRPDEAFLIAEVYELPDKLEAAALHEQWESDMAEFHELMSTH